MFRTFQLWTLIVVVSIALGAPGQLALGADQPAAAEAGPAAANSAAKADAARTAWFKDAKFGMFIHWGLYAIPAGEWKGKTVPGIGEWIMNRGKVPVDEYAELAKQFNPVKFNADEWVQLAQDAGMRYMAITSKHHDGFAIFGTKISPYNIVDATPFKRDALKELADACQRRGMRLGFYYSQSQDWHHPGGAASGGSWDPAQEGDFDQYLKTIALPQVRELLTGYAPVALIWFDTPLNMTDERAKPFVDAIRELQPKCLINSRLLLRGADIRNLTAEQIAQAAALGCDYISRGDNEIPPRAVPGAWETPATLNDTWGFRKDDHNWKTPDDVIFKLVDIVSKGGNYLLNVGPTAEGVIPEESAKVLREVGKWLAVNGEAIYGTDPTPFGREFGREVPQPEAKGKKAKGRRQPVIEGALDWRCTTKPGKLYIHLVKWPGAAFEFEGVPQKVERVTLLADPQGQALEFSQAGEKLQVTLPAEAPGKYIQVLRVEFAQ